MPMHLKSVYISQYKNLKNLTLPFDGNSFIDVFVGKNGSGKSNFIEALIKIFRHLDQLGHADNIIDFEYKLNYEIDDKDVDIEWKNGKLRINKYADRKTLGKIPFPDNLLIYYSGHNTTVTDLITYYEEKFADRIRTAGLGESRRFIGIGPKYKFLLLAMLLVQPDASPARSYISNKLGIDKLGIISPGTDKISEPVLRIELKRPGYAEGKNEFNIVDNDETDRYWKAEGTTKDFLSELNDCIWNNTDNLTVTEGYLADDRYVHYLSIGKLQHIFNGKWQELFRKFDNLKTLGMLADITVPLLLTSGIAGNLSHFSDGQFQTVYIYSIIELFKDRNCITLLDEPDSFLHPEWQFDFLKQVFEITHTVAKKNHVLMSSHSASTITTANESVINLFEFSGNNVSATKVKKNDVIKSLSAGLITFSETEARLNIHHVLNNTSGSVLFTEGITDEMILETAWSKLYPDRQRNFEIQNAFSCGFLRNLVNDKEIYQNYPGRIFFSIFDFDEAFKDWNQLGQDVQVDPEKCLIKKHGTHDSYSLLLPVPTNQTIRKQVINPHTGGNYGDRSLLTIEHLFYGIDGLDSYYVVDTSRTDQFLKFVSKAQKVPFAKEIVPKLHRSHFEIFKPVFEFIESILNTETVQV